MIPLVHDEATDREIERASVSLENCCCHSVGHSAGEFLDIRVKSVGFGDTPVFGGEVAEQYDTVKFRFGVAVFDFGKRSPVGLGMVCVRGLVVGRGNGWGIVDSGGCRFVAGQGA